MTTIKYNQGAQIIRLAPVDKTGHAREVTAATYSILDLRYPEDADKHVVVASTATTETSVTTTLTAAAGPQTANPRRATLTDTTDFRVGGLYLFEDDDQATAEDVRVVRVDAANSEIALSRDLRFAYTAVATVTSLELEGTFPADVAADEARLDSGGGPFQVTWVYTIGSELYLSPVDLWLTRYGVAPWVTPGEMLKFLPGYPVGDQVSPEEAISAATDDLIEGLLAAGWSERDPARFRSHPSSSLYVSKRAWVYMLRGSRADDSVALQEMYAGEALQHMGNMTTGRPPARSVVIDEVNLTAQAGGETKGGYGLFARS